MYLNPTGIENAKKLSISQDAWMLLQFENHINDWRIVFYLIQGEGDLTVEGETLHLKAHQAIAVEAGKERFWSNTGKDVLQLLAIKTRMNS